MSQIFFGNPSTATGQSINLSMLTETDNSVAIIWSPKLRMLAQLSETEASVALAKRKQRAITQLTETESSFVLGRTKRRTLVQLSETESPFALSKRKMRVIAQLTESDGTFVIGKTKGRVIAQLTETETATILGKVKTYTLAMLNEAESLTAQGKIKQKSFVQLQETDLLYAMTVETSGTEPTLVDLGQVTEQDSLFALTIVKSRLLGMLSEIENLQGLGKQKQKELGQLNETDGLANILWSPKLRMLGMLIEQDQAGRISPPTPTERTFLVYYKGRVFIVSAEARLSEPIVRENTLVVVRDNRVMEIFHE